MSFRFPLATVLRYRESLEQREYFALERIQQEVSHVELRIRQVEEELSAAVHNRAAQLAHGVPAAEVQTAYEYSRALEEQDQGLQNLLKEAKMKWRQQLASYELARRNRETLEKLREKQFEAFSKEQAKREQAVIDDLFLSRHGSRRGHGH
jgi:flagellar FliJ protein